MLSRRAYEIGLSVNDEPVNKRSEEFARELEDMLASFSFRLGQLHGMNLRGDVSERLNQIAELLSAARIMLSDEIDERRRS